MNDTRVNAKQLKHEGDAIMKSAVELRRNTRKKSTPKSARKKGDKRGYQKANSEMLDLNLIPSKIMSNVNGLKAPNTRQVVRLDKNANLHHMHL